MLAKDLFTVINYVWVRMQLRAAVINNNRYAKYIYPTLSKIVVLTK